MADEAALAFQPGGSQSPGAAEREAAPSPAGEPLRKRPRRDGPGLGWSPGEPGGSASEREVPAAAAGTCPAVAALWREAPAATGDEREAQAAAVAGGGDNGPGLQGLSREPPPAEHFCEDDDDDEEGEEEEEAAAAAIGYRGAQGAGGRHCASPPPAPGAPPGVRRGGPRARGGSAAIPSPPRPRRGRPGCRSCAHGLPVFARSAAPLSGLACYAAADGASSRPGLWK